MGGCSALNCTNHSRKKIRMFTFPTEPDRRKLWTIRCRRKDWVPGRGAQLCFAHFEESQFEQNRQDGWKKLKATAVPTLFKKATTIHTDIRIRKSKYSTPDPIIESHLDVSKKEDNQQSGDELLRKIVSLKKETESLKDVVKEKELSLKVALLEKENESLRNAVREKDKILSSFLSEEQIASLSINKQNISHWGHESITEALKMRINLGKKGYNYLRQTGYPLPSYSTLNRRIQKMKCDIILGIGGDEIDENDIEKYDLDEYLNEDDVDDNDTDMDQNAISEDDASENS